MNLAGLDAERSGIVGEAPADLARPQPAGLPRGKSHKAISTGFCAFVAALALWVFAYGSGLFPWLGAAEIDETNGPGWSQIHGNLEFGLGTMLLFEGQTAFFEYNSTGKAGEILFDVRPIGMLGYSERVQYVRETGEGRIEFPIGKTGLYTFSHLPSVGRPYGRTTYSVSWGAH